MKNSRQAFLDKWKETTDISPQTVGWLTPLYKETTKRLKVMPLPMMIIASIIMVGLIVYLFGSSVTRLVSLLQRGF